MKRIKYNRSRFTREYLEGETIEQKVHRMTVLNEAITDGAPILYTEKKDGVLPEHNIRTDKWEIATDAMNVVHKADIAKGDAKPENKGENAGEPPKEGSNGGSSREGE